MAILTPDKLFEAVHNYIGERSEDADIQFMEDVTDTVNALTAQRDGDNENWKQKYHDLDQSWKKKYRHRFFAGGVNNPDTGSGADDGEEDNSDTIKIDDLFKDK